MNPSIEQRIEEAAQKHGIRIDSERPSFSAEDFTYGANFVLNTILPEFAEWMNDYGWEHSISGTWHSDVHRNPVSTPQLIELFKNRDNGVEKKGI